MRTTFPNIGLGLLIVVAGASSHPLRGNEPIVFRNDTKAPATVQVVRTTESVACDREPASSTGRTTDLLEPDESWTSDQGPGCWAWSPGKEGFSANVVKRWCVMTPGKTYQLAATSSQQCRVDD
jgi:hypothetical protein